MAGARSSSGSPVPPRSWEGRCSCWMVITREGARSATADISAGEVVISTSVSMVRSARCISTSDSASKVASHFGLIRSLGSPARCRQSSAVRSLSRTGRSVLPVRSTR